MAEKQKKDFTPMNKLLAAFCVFFLLTQVQCKDDQQASDCFINEAGVNFTINTDLPSYFKLKDLGSYVFLEGGNRGIFLVHDFDDTYHAVERTCSYQSESNCSFIQVDSTLLNLRCGTYIDGKFTTCCTSKYTFSGILLEGPSRCGLRKYKITQQGNILYIRN